MNTSRRSVPAIYSVIAFDSPAFQIWDGDTTSGFCLPQRCLRGIYSSEMHFVQTVHTIFTSFFRKKRRFELRVKWLLASIGILNIFSPFTVTKSINICISQIDIRHGVFIDLLSTQLTWLEMFYDIGSTTWPLSFVQKFKITSMNYVFYKFTPILLILFAWNANIFMKGEWIRNEQRNKTV